MPAAEPSISEPRMETPRTSPRPNGVPPKRRPDPRPMRIALGLGTFAAMSVLTGGLVRLSPSDTDAADGSPVAAPAVGEEALHLVRYVQLRPGEQPPPGALVVQGTDPTPRIVVTTLPGDRQATTASRRRSTARSRQSGG